MSKSNNTRVSFLSVTVAGAAVSDGNRAAEMMATKVTGVSVHSLAVTRPSELLSLNSGNSTYWRVC